MEISQIHFKSTGYFSKIIEDYLDSHPSLTPFYQYKPELDSFQQIIENKTVAQNTREVLSTALLDQYQTDKVSLKNFQEVEKNITSLRELETYTVTTGHQLCLFTGPLYFIYKIVSTIKLAQSLKEKFPEKDFVPVYWMATEDHDFEEINHFNFQGKKIEWNTEQVGAVGRMTLDGISEVLGEFENLLTPYSANAEELKKLFQNAYLKHNTLAAATRYLVNELFGEYGVIIVDGDDVTLKQLFLPIIQKELETSFSSKEVEKQSEKLAERYKIQVNPREINLFYLSESGRNRIIKENDTYFIHDTSKHFSESEIQEELKNHPERFSPNVLLRPVYQECILPNLAYIGGGGELAYWFQLKTTFESVSIPMPMLVLRNSVAWMNEKQSKAYKQLNISIEDLFKEEGVLTKEWIIRNTKEDISLSDVKQAIDVLFDQLLNQTKQIDTTLDAHVKALQAKYNKDLRSLSNKFIRAERRKEQVSVDRINYLKNTLFKNRGLQERSSNFSEVYLRYGKSMIEILLDKFCSPTDQFIVIH